LIIFDCNGVLVDSERIVASVASQELTRAGFALAPEVFARYFTGRRPADMFTEIERAARRRLPANFELTLKTATLARFRRELRATAHVVHALTWLREPKCVASSSPFDRIRLSLETTDLIRFFDPYLFSGTEVPKGKPAPDLFLLAAAKMHVQPADCIVVEDSPVGVAAAVAAGMTAIGFVGGSHAGDQLATQLKQEGARVTFSDMRMLKSTIVNLRGW
jgi:HAD superfamily hydrolase (TIGR01509 family)